MKLATLRLDTPLGTIERVAALRGGAAIDLAAAHEALLRALHGVDRAEALAAALFPADMATFLGGWPIARGAAEAALAFAESLSEAEAERFPLTGRRLIHPAGTFSLGPALRPVRIRDYLTFEAHKKQAMARRGLPMPDLWYRMPTYTNRNHGAVAGPDEPIRWPAHSRKLDFEFEIGLVVARSGRDIAAEDAASYIAGFTIYNDLSARDVQEDERTCGSGPGKSKDFDQGNVIGPCIVTPDEIDGQAIAMRLVVDGEEWATGSTAGMRHSWADIIVNASRNETIRPGELLASGTMDGGCCVEQGRWFQPGAIIEMHAEGIGTLRNRII